MSKMHFISGMPRSGSTLLCNILSQNPRFRATGTSPLPQLLATTSQVWNNSNECKANYTDDDKFHCLRNIMDNYHLPFDSEVVFDKSRAWPANIELLTEILGEKPKILTCIRYMPAVASSFEKIWRKEIVKFGGIPEGMTTIEDRLKFWTDKKSILGSSYYVLQDAVQRGHRDCMHLVGFQNLTVYPKQTLEGIHDFLEEPWFEYDFDNVEQVIHEKDEFHGFSKDSLHKIRSNVAPVKPDFLEIIGEDMTKQLEEAFDYKFFAQ